MKWYISEYTGDVCLGGVSICYKSYDGISYNYLGNISTNMSGKDNITFKKALQLGIHEIKLLKKHNEYIN
jgi:hypothetical protein